MAAKRRMLDSRAMSSGGSETTAVDARPDPGARASTGATAPIRPRGRLIAIEGIDGAGKSTVAGDVVAMVAELGRNAVLLDRNTACAAAAGYHADHLGRLRELIWEYPATARTSELGFWHWAHLLASWFHAVDHTVVRPALEGGAYVVADSWYFKFVARFALTVDLAQATELFRGISRPDLVVLLTADPELCADRRRDLRTTEMGEWQNLDGGRDAFVEYQGRVRSVYARLASAGAWEVVASTDRSTVAAQLRRRLLEASESWRAEDAARAA